jgi:hypothetical protein
MSLSFAKAKATHDRLNAEVVRTEEVLKTFPTCAMGLTPDAVKFSPEFRNAKQAFNAAFARLRAFNAVFTKTFAKELCAERRERSALRSR